MNALTGQGKRVRRKKQPYNPAHDRKANDLLRNALVAPVEVDDPYEIGGRIIVMRSIRHDPLADMFARGSVDECEYETGRHWQQAYEDSEIGGARAVDPTKEAVDGGLMPDALTDRQRQAVVELKRAREELGTAGDLLIRSILGEGRTIEQMAWEWWRAEPGHKGYRYTVIRFHECLKTLSELYGYANER